MKNHIVDTLKSLLQTPKQIVIISHKNPDGDAMGSSLALLLMLKSLGHKVSCILPNEFPPFLEWMPQQENINIYEHTPDESKELIENSDVIFTLDFNNLSRVGEPLSKILYQYKKTFVMIDHHKSPENYTDIQFLDTSIGSTCELLYDIFKQMGWENHITKDIANCIYTGIFTDSGSFKFPRTTAKTHIIVSELIRKGAENVEININIYNQNKPNQIKILGYALSKMKILPNLGIAYVLLSKKELNQLGYYKGSTENIINFGLSVKGINFAAIFTESMENDYIKISFRSIGDFQVDAFANKYFNGGGHLNAAGGICNLSLEKTEQKFLKLATIYKNDILNSHL